MSSVDHEKLSGPLQENLLTLLAYSDEYCQMVRNTVEPYLFSTFIYREIVTAIYTFIDQYHKAPKDHLPDLLEDELAEKNEKSETLQDILHNVHILSESLNETYVISKLEAFIRQQSLKLGIIEATEEIQKGRIDEAELRLQDALKARTEIFDPGVTLVEGLQRLQQDKDKRDVLLTGIKELDRRELGPARKELHLFLAPPKRGKSWWLLHLAKRGLMQRLKVAVVSLEMSQAIYVQRFLQSLFSITKRESKVMVSRFELDELGRLTGFDRELLKRPFLEDPKHQQVLAKKLAKFHFRNNLFVKSFSTRSLTINGLRAYLDSLERIHRFVPDLLILDYADLMKVDTNNLRISLGALYADLRGVAVERNIALATASQANRAGAGARLITETEVAEDFSKIAISDCVISHNQTKAEKALGLARLFVTNSRNEEDKFAVLLSQSYPLGQFVLESAPILSDYWELMESASSQTQSEGSDESA